MKWDLFHYLLLSYIGIYFIAFSFIFVAHAFLVPDKEKQDDEPWETPLDVFLIIVGFVGMIFLFINLQSSSIKEIWRPVSIALLATQLFLKWRAEKIHFSKLTPEELKEFHVVSSITNLLLLPSLALNIYYAFWW